MQKVNSLYGKSIVHQATGNRIAMVRDTVLDAEVSHLMALLADEGQLLGATRVIRWHAVVSVGDVIVINSVLPLPAISEDQEVADLLAQLNLITGTTIISDGGKQIGTVGDLFIDDHGAIVGYEVKQGLICGFARAQVPASQRCASSWQGCGHRSRFRAYDRQSS